MTSDGVFVFAGRVYRVPPSSLQHQAGDTFYSKLSADQKEAFGVGVGALCLLCGFYLVIQLQSTGSANSAGKGGANGPTLKVYSTGAPLYRRSIAGGRVEIHPALVSSTKEEVEDFSAELAMLGSRLNELVTEPSSFPVLTERDFASACQKLAKSRQAIALFKTYNFAEFASHHHPFTWNNKLEDDLVIKASCAIAAIEVPEFVSYEPNARRIGTLQRAMRRRTYDSILLRVLFCGIRQRDNYLFDELIEPTKHVWMNIECGTWQRFLLSSPDVEFSSCSVECDDLVEFELAVKQTNKTLSWAVCFSANGEPSRLFGDRGFSVLGRYDVILDSTGKRVYFNLSTVLPKERRDIVAAMWLNRPGMEQEEEDEEEEELWFPSHRWTICAQVPETDEALQVVDTLAQAKRLHRKRPEASVAVVVEDTILLLQH